MRKLASRLPEHRALEIIGGRQRRVTALTRQCDPAPRCPHDTPDAQARAGADHGHHGADSDFAGRRRRCTPMAQLIGAQPWQRQRLGLEIVQTEQRLQPQLLLGGGAREAPGRVGQLNPVAIQRRGERKRRTARRREAGRTSRQIGAHRIGRACMGGHRQHPHVLDRRTEGGHGTETGIGATDIRNQPRELGAHRTALRRSPTIENPPHDSGRSDERGTVARRAGIRMGADTGKKAESISQMTVAKLHAIDNTCSPQAAECSGSGRARLPE
mmetsp:Transcript_41418/g.97064  ORF Transcript_41418/g.97064 Transcript_41418/m.97064 type:complete len:271 (+) Transcript_41418:4560-5372(+)